MGSYEYVLVKVALIAYSDSSEDAQRLVGIDELMLVSPSG